MSDDEDIELRPGEALLIMQDRGCARVVRVITHDWRTSYGRPREHMYLQDGRNLRFAEVHSTSMEVEMTGSVLTIDEVPSFGGRLSDLFKYLAKNRIVAALRRAL